MKLKAQIMDEAALSRALMRIAHEILEHNKGAEDLLLVGIRRRGEPIARRIGDNILKIEGQNVPCGSIDIGFYRDDLSRLGEMPELRRTELPFSVADRDLVLVTSAYHAGHGTVDKWLADSAVSQDGRAILPEAIRARMYPQDVDSSEPLSNRDAHVEYVGQIVSAYIIR